MQELSQNEILKLAIQIEKNGRDFYSSLALKSDKEKNQKTFLYLSEEENKHIVILKDILDSFREQEPEQVSNAKSASSINTLAGNFVFTKEDMAEKLASDIKSNKEALEIAIDFEKKSIAFYEDMKNVMPVYDYRILDGLVAQEKNHIKKLNNLLEGVNVMDNFIGDILSWIKKS